MHRIPIVPALATAGALLASCSLADVYPILYGHGTPLIDGSLSPGEWQGNVAEFEVVDSGSGETWGTARFMDDGANMYWAIVIGPGAYDFFVATIDLDDDDDDVCDTGEDFLYFDGLFYDMVQVTNCSSQVVMDFNAAGTQDGEGHFTFGAGGVVMEISHPLASADVAHDIAIASGQRAGFRLNIAVCLLGNCTGTQMYPGTAYSSGAFAVGALFTDNFESGATNFWSMTVGPP
jgi:hypothetical protein